MLSDKSSWVNQDKKVEWQVKLSGKSNQVIRQVEWLDKLGDLTRQVGWQEKSSDKLSTSQVKWQVQTSNKLSDKSKQVIKSRQEAS